MASNKSYLSQTTILWKCDQDRIQSQQWVSTMSTKFNTNCCHITASNRLQVSPKLSVNWWILPTTQKNCKSTTPTEKGEEESHWNTFYSRGMTGSGWSTDRQEKKDRNTICMIRCRNNTVMPKLTCHPLASIFDSHVTKYVFLILHNIWHTLLNAYWTFLDCSTVNVLWLYSIAYTFKAVYFFRISVRT